MKSISCLILTALISLTCLKTEAQAAKTSSKSPDIKATFSRFFEYDESDSSQVVKKLALAKQICETDSASSYCQYAAVWALVIGNNEQTETALKTIEKLERDQPEWAEIYFLHAQYLYYKKEPGYIEKAQKSIELNPNLIRPVFFLAVSYYEAQNYKLSLVYYDKLEKLNPTHWSLYYNRGNVKDRLADYTGSIADYTKALELQPGHYRAMFNRGHAYLVLENYAKAEPDFDAFIKMMPTYTRAYYYRGYSRYFLGNRTGCCEDMQKAASMGDKESASFISKYCQ